MPLLVPPEGHHLPPAIPQPPTLITIFPNFGDPQGGEFRVITGKHLSDVRSVTIDGVPATILRTAPGYVHILTPTHVSASGLDVVVLNAVGKASLDGAFSYTGSVGVPTVSSVSPAQIDTHGDTLVEVTGTGFIGNPTVTIGGIDAPVAWVESETVLWVRAPSHAPATGLDVVVTTIAGPSTGGSGLVEAWYPDQVVSATPHIYDPERGVTESSGIVSIADQGSGAETVTHVSTKPPLLANRLEWLRRKVIAWNGVPYNAGPGTDVLALAAPIPFTSVSTFTVMRWDGLGVAGEFRIGTGSGVLDFALDKSGGAFGIRMYEANAGFNHFKGTGLDDGTPHTVGQTLDGSDQPNSVLKMYIDGVQAGSTDTFPTYGTANWNRLGDTVSNPLFAWTSAFVITEGVVSAPERTRIENWLRAQWVQGTPVTSLVSQGQYHPCDGAWLLKGLLPNELYKLNGWDHTGGTGGFPGPSIVTNQILRSTDGGATFSEFLAQDLNPPDNRPPPQHAVGYIVHDDGGVLYAYQIGGDGFYSGYHANVYRAPLTDLTQWEKFGTGPWVPDILACYFSLNGSLYKVGGQTDGNDHTTAHARVYRSDDGGKFWLQIDDAPFVGGVISNPIPVATVAGKKQAIIVAGGTYDDDLVRDYYDAVRTFDGKTWTTWVAEGTAPYVKRQYNSVVVFRGHVVLLKGFGGAGSDQSLFLNLKDVWAAPLSDLTAWTELRHKVDSDQPGPGSHADGVCVDADRIYIGPGNGGIGDGIGYVFKIEPIAF
jgi:hypothetical protein